MPLYPGTNSSHTESSPKIIHDPEYGFRPRLTYLVSGYDMGENEAYALYLVFEYSCYGAVLYTREPVVKVRVNKVYKFNLTWLATSVRFALRIRGPSWRAEIAAENH